MYLLALKFAKVRGAITQDRYLSLQSDLIQLPEQIENLLGMKEKIQRFANRYLAADHMFFIGRGIDYAISLEGSLKLKEISYIHSEAYAAGELKHGTISLIEDNTGSSLGDPRTAISQDDQQHRGGENPRSFRAGRHQLRPQRNREKCRLCHLYS